MGDLAVLLAVLIPIAAAGLIVFGRAELWTFVAAIAAFLLGLSLLPQVLAGGRPAIEVGIGINAGEAFTGVIGSPRRLEYTAVGDVVNVAARLCDVAGPGEIMTDAETARDLPPHIPVTAVEPMRLKGLSEPVAVCRVG